MKIVQIIPSLSRGGAERFVVDLSNELAKNDGLNVVLISLFHNDETITFLSELDSRVSYYSLGKRAGIDPKVFIKVYHLIKDLQPSVIHAHLGALEYIIPVKFAFPEIKMFFTVHNQANKECPGPRAIIKLIRKRLFNKNYIHPIVISSRSAISFEQFYGLSRYTKIENGCPSIERTSASETIRTAYLANNYDYLLVNIARLNPQKNQELLIQAVNRINRSQQMRLKLLIVGEIQDKLYFSKLQAHLVDDSIEFVGGKSNVGDYLFAADFFCLSSIYEGMPISLIEALSCGCIPIVTAVGGIVDMVSEGKTGFLSKGLQLQDYMDAIFRAINNTNKEEISQQAIETFKERFHIHITAEKYLILFKNGK